MKEGELGNLQAWSNMKNNFLFLYDSLLCAYISVSYAMPVNFNSILSQLLPGNFTDIFYIYIHFFSSTVTQTGISSNDTKADIFIIS